MSDNLMVIILLGLFSYKLVKNKIHRAPDDDFDYGGKKSINVLYVNKDSWKCNWRASDSVMS